MYIAHSLIKKLTEPFSLSSPDPFLFNFRDELDPVEEKVDYLKVEEASPYLTFEQGDGGCTLKGGEIDALIAYAASTSSSGMRGRSR